MFYGYTIVLAAFCALVIFDGMMYTFGVFFKPLTAEFGWARAMTSGAFSLFQLVNGLFIVVAGTLNDRFGPRMVITFSGILFGLGYLLMSQVNAVWQLYLFYGVLAAMGMSGSLVPLSSTVARWFIKRRGMMTGVVISGIGVGLIVVPPIASQLILGLGWRTSYLVTGIISAVVIILAAQLLRRDPAQKGQLPYGAGEENPAGLKIRGFSLQEAIRTSQFWQLAAMYFCFGFTLMAVMTHIVPHATDVGMSAIVAASFLSIIGGASIVGRIGLGGASDRFGGKRCLIISFILLQSAFIWLLVTREAWMFYLFAAVYGLAYGGLAALMSPTAAGLFGLKSHGAIFGVIMLINSIGGAISPVLTGWIFDKAGNYYFAFLICIVVSVAGLIVATRLKPLAKAE